MRLATDCIVEGRKLSDAILEMDLLGVKTRSNKDSSSGAAMDNAPSYTD